MGYPGSGSRRARRRSVADAVPHLSALHFPLGGARFRPAIEDVLQMVIEEFGVDHAAGWRGVLERAREDWRVLQLKSAVRDDLESAAEVLRDHGYSVQRSDGEVPQRGKPLRRY